VRFLGLVDDMSVVYWRASFIVLSSNTEGMPMAPLEAAVYGRPAVATAVGGTPEVVLDEQTGLLVKPDDVALLAEAIIRLLGNSALSQTLGSNARALVQGRHSSAARAVVLGNYFSGLTK